MFTLLELVFAIFLEKRHSKLLRNINKDGIDNLPFLGFISLLVKLIVKIVKQIWASLEIAV